MNRFSQNDWGLLWDICESPTPNISGWVLHNHYSDEARSLTRTRLLIPSKAMEYAHCPACDSEHELPLYFEDSKFWVICPKTGKHPIPAAHAHFYTVNWPLFAQAIQSHIGLKGSVEEQAPRLFWDLGLGHFGKRHQRIYLSRRLPHHRVEAETYFRRMPSDRNGIILSTSPIQQPDLPGNIRIVSLYDLFQHNEPEFAIQTLDRMMVGEAPISSIHAEDFRWVIWNGEKHVFRGEKQRKIVAHIFQSHMAGQTPIRTSEMLIRLGEDASSRLSEIFKGHKSWKALIDHGSGMCALRE